MELLKQSGICIEVHGNGQEITETDIDITPENLGYQKISPEDMRVWQAFLPRCYKAGHLIDYLVTQAPQAVIGAWQEAKVLRLFQDFSVRTPEGKSTIAKIIEKVRDPVLIGWFEEDPYLIARWGESLKTFAQIKMRVLARRIIESVIGIVALALLFCIGVICTAWVVQAPKWNSLMWYGSYLMVFPIVLSILSVFLSSVGKLLKVAFIEKTAAGIFYVGIVLLFVGVVWGLVLLVIASGFIMVFNCIAPVLIGLSLLIYIFTRR